MSDTEILDYLEARLREYQSFVSFRGETKFYPAHFRRTFSRKGDPQFMFSSLRALVEAEAKGEIL